MARGFKTLITGCQVADAATEESGYNYYGYNSSDKRWVIMREKTDETEYRYAVGSNAKGVAYSTAWTNRATQDYRLPEGWPGLFTRP